MSRSLLITGAAGFIGANFTHYWARAHPDDRLVAYDALTYAGNLENLAPLRDRPDFSFVHADICDYDTVLGTLREHAVASGCDPRQFVLTVGAAHGGRRRDRALVGKHRRPGERRSGDDRVEQQPRAAHESDQAEHEHEVIDAAEESLLGINPDHVHTHVARECSHHLVAFLVAQ